MGRPGGGGGGGHHSSGGSFGGSHRSGGSFGGGHRVGSSSSRSFNSSRPGNGGARRTTSYSSGRPSAPPPPPRYGGPMGGPPPRGPRYYGGGYRGGYSRGYRREYTRSSGGGCLSTIASLIFIIVIVAAIGFLLSSSGTSGTGKVINTTARERLNICDYNSRCIIDETGYIENKSNVERELKTFWDKTGVQPYVYLKAYDPDLRSDSQKDAWTKEFYENNFTNQDTFLFVYFDEDVDYPYATCWSGAKTSLVIDDEAMDIFWRYSDGYWDTTNSTDEFVIKTFNDTAKKIMSNPQAEVKKTGYLVVGGVVVAIVLTVFTTNMVKMKHKRAKEKAEEDQRILDTPMDTLTGSSLEEKYLGGSQTESNNNESQGMGGH